MTVGWLGGIEVLQYAGTSKTGVPMGVLTDRLTEMKARHAASTEAARREFAELQKSYEKLMQTADRLLEDLGPCDE